MLSYLTNLILFLLLATITKSQTNSSSSTTTTLASSTSTTTVAPSTTSSTTASTNASTTATTTSVTNGSLVISIIRNNATSNYLLYPFASTTENFTLPFAINQCSLFNINEDYYIKPVCVSNKLVNVSYYNNSACSSKPYYFETVSNTSIFRCNESNNYAELYMNTNSSCSNKATTYVGINYCFPTLLGYASFFCSGEKVQYASFNSSSCVNNGLLTISQVNSTSCGPFIGNSSTYVALSECINNITSPSTTSNTSTTTSSGSTTSTTKASTTSTTKGVTTSSTSSSSTSTSTTKSSRTSSGSSVFIFNNVVYILSIITIFNIIIS